MAARMVGSSGGALVVSAWSRSCSKRGGSASWRKSQGAASQRCAEVAGMIWATRRVRCWGWGAAGAPGLEEAEEVMEIAGAEDLAELLVVVGGVGEELEVGFAVGGESHVDDAAGDGAGGEFEVSGCAVGGKVEAGADGGDV